MMQVAYAHAKSCNMIGNGKQIHISHMINMTMGGDAALDIVH